MLQIKTDNPGFTELVLRAWDNNIITVNEFRECLALGKLPTGEETQYEKNKRESAARR